MNIGIIIPAYNEEQRIGRTVETYYNFFYELLPGNDFHMFIVLNGCTDNTYHVAETFKNQGHDKITLVQAGKAGKGRAIKRGFLEALTYKNLDIIGFVDADMATEPAHFAALCMAIDFQYDAAIANRYNSQSHVFPNRPWIKRWGSRIFYESLIKLLFSMVYDDYQCGAKAFRRKALEIIATKLTVEQWAFDVELLYLCKRYNIRVKQVPTVWYDREGSKLRISSGIKMIWHIIKLRFYYFFE